MFNSGILGWHTKGVPPHGMKDIVALHAFVAGHYVPYGVIPDMTHVYPA
jgi:hypothetical protein